MGWFYPARRNGSKREPDPGAARGLLRTPFHAGGFTS
jgi:hypothetical protein